MKSILFLCSLIVAPVLLAQTPAPAPVAPPSGPLLKNTAEFASWTVTTTSGSQDKKDEAQKPGGKPVVNTDNKKVTVVKTGKIRYELSVDAAGNRLQKWYLNGYLAIIAPNSDPVVSSASPFKIDFPELGWVSAKTFQSVSLVNGRKCLIFANKEALQNQSSAGSPSPTPKPEIGGEANDALVAYIDEASRLPVTLYVNDVVSTYQFGQTPSALLTPPDNVKAAVLGLQKQIQQASAPVAAP